jgi:hypothetical protein
VRGLRGRWQQELAARGVDRDQAMALDRRFADAVARVIARWPQAFARHRDGPDANRRQLEALVNAHGDLAASLKGGADDAAVSPTTKLAAMLKEALAANTIGGKVDVEEPPRAAQEDVRQAQASWSRIGPVATRRAARSRSVFSARSTDLRVVLTAGGVDRPAYACQSILISSTSNTSMPNGALWP